METDMNKPLYKRELSHSYLVVEDVPEELAGHYQYRMILRNRIPGLLASSERYLEGKTCLYYDISSRQSLEQLYLSARIGLKEIRGIVDNLAQALDCDPQQINVKATRGEGLGFVGREEGVLAQAVVLLEKTEEQG